MASASGDRGYDMVAAIDFGTTHSGYAYSFTPGLQHTRLNQTWHSSLGLTAQKTSTCLLTKNGEIYEFGFEAEARFSKLRASNQAEGCELWRHFKLLLLKEKELSRETMLESVSGTQRPALEIFALSLHYMKKHLAETVRTQENKDIEDLQVRWVVTIPAIWSDKAKQFMREAACQAGLIDSVESRQLMLALEPEVAALYCQALNAVDFQTSEQSGPQVDLSVGTKFMVIDAGGGTVDIAVQEVCEDNQIRQLTAPSGGKWGGHEVNSKFLNLMRAILGKDFTDKYKAQSPNKWLEFEMQFESRKRATAPDGEFMINLPINTAMQRSYNQITGKDIENEICKFKDELGVYAQDGDIIINSSTVLDMFVTQLNYIIPHVEKLSESPDLKNMKYIFLVGGFAESPMLLKGISSAMGRDKTVLCPRNCGMAVLHGAILFGHVPEKIKSRVASRTYGRKIFCPFNDDIHPPERLFVSRTTGQRHCKDLFQTFVRKGEEVQINDEKIFITVPIEADQTSINIQLLSSDSSQVRFIDEEGVEEHGVVEIQMPDTSKGVDRDMETRVKFGQTEIQVEARDLSRDDSPVVKTKIDFLCD